MYSIGIDTLIPIAMMIAIGLIFCCFYSWYISSYVRDIKKGNADIELLDEAIYENLSRVRKRKKIIKTINSIVFYGLLICIAPFFIFSIINKMQGNITNFKDKGVLAVASGSMSQKNPANDYIIEHNLTNQFNTYDLIVVEAVTSDENLELYDVVTFVDSSGTLLIHRIIKIETDENGVVTYTTRGDSNNSSDAPITIDNIRGKYTNTRVPYIGAIVLFFQSALGIVTLAILSLCLIVNDKQMAKVLNAKNKRLEKFDMIDFKKSKKKSPSYTVTIYYLDVIYHFNQKGFIKKDKNINGKEYSLEKNELVKIYKEENKEPITNRYTIEK